MSASASLLALPTLSVAGGISNAKRTSLFLRKKKIKDHQMNDFRVHQETCVSSLELDSIIQRILNATTLYQVLDVPPDASNDRIRKNYLRISRWVHPGLLRNIHYCDFKRFS